MARDVLESVFIAWGGNHPLATLVADGLARRHFRPVIGGHQQTDTFIGTQVLSQIHRCTRAIVLVQTIPSKSTAPGFSDNLMFEWGYITGTFAPGKVHVFLIDLSARDLPSDLAGSWASEVVVDGCPLDQVADRVTEQFQRDALHHVELDKMRIMHMWTRILGYIESYDTDPACPDMELAHYLLHSIETCYYYMEEDRLEALLASMHPLSSLLEHAVQIATANIRLFRETAGLQRALPFDSFTELRAVFERNVDVSFQDPELTLWFSYFCARRLSLLYFMTSKNEDLEEAEQLLFLERTLTLLDETAAVLDRIVAEFPQEASYVNLFWGYVHRDRYLIHELRGERAAAEEASLAALRAKEAFYLDYKARYPQDALLVRHLAQEYYLSLADHLPFVTDATERMMTKRTVRTFLTKLERESGRQHVVLEELRAKFRT